MEMVNNKSEALKLIEGDLYNLLSIANKVREKHFGRSIKFCSVVNAKSGKCSEDCKFCSQSSHYNANIAEYRLKEPKEILSAAKDVQKNGAVRFGIVTSGRRIVSEEEWGLIYDSIKLLRVETSLLIDASLGYLDLEHARLLKEGGLSRYHHNLETSPAFFPKICTTHNYEDRLNTVRVVKEAGLELCCGGLFGLGESWNDRIELGFILKEIDPDSVPLNFLNPIPGMPLADTHLLTPEECLRIIALFRLILPDKDISVCGGREKNLCNMQNQMYCAGANGTMLGNYLTTLGRAPQEDLQMIEDLGLVRWERQV